MNDTILLESENFRLTLDFQVFESDISYPSNTILSVSVSSEGFARRQRSPSAPANKKRTFVYRKRCVF